MCYKQLIFKMQVSKFVIHYSLHDYCDPSCFGGLYSPIQVRSSEVFFTETKYVRVLVRKETKLVKIIVMNWGPFYLNPLFK
jgi:hypothetical protein